MHPRPSRSVLRYFVPSDAFVRIAVLEGAHAALAAQPGLTRGAYRRLVIDACCPQLGPDAWTRLRQDCPEDPLAAEDLLYQLCIEVNPHLDIHVVQLREANAEQPAPAVETGDVWRRALQRRVRGLERRLERRVIGQREAIAAATRCVARAAAGLHGADRPLAALLFVGRTGTGKTELARALSRELYADGPQPRLVRIDCSEFASSHEYAKLIGSPPGYIGHEHGGMLTEALKRTPDCVVLFDEIEKAHPRLHNLLLQVLDEGRLTDGRGRTVDVTRAVLCLTSNVGAREVRRAGQRVGFGADSGVERATVEELTRRALEEQFAPEFLARLDERLVFRDLDLGDARAVAAKLLGELGLRARTQRAKLMLSPAVAGWVARRGFDPDNGARELRRVIQTHIEAPLAELLLGPRPAGGAVEVRIARGAPRLRWAA
jgi:ATP-dependent Clp protease ATP-binding subunit ClpC